MFGSTELHTTARTPQLTPGDVPGLMAEIRANAAAAGRTEPLDLLFSYQDSSLAADPAADADRHREAFAGTYLSQ